MSQSIEEAFLKLITIDWYSLPKEFRDKFRPYRSKTANRRGSVGYKIMLEMLEQCGYEIVVKESKLKV